ncbi:MAG: GIY-YIG nuclease family protein, partial [Candidatus Eremiobacterales bacterium]
IKKLEDNGVFTYGALLEFLRHRAARKRPAPKRLSSITQLPVWTSILRQELEEVPPRPGVYLLKDAGGTVVYVGKSRSLRQRLRTYASGAKPATAKVRALRGVVASFDYLVTGSELEALLLEAELVRSHDPPFNDRLRDFRDFAFVKVEAGAYPRLLTTTRLVADGARYYGPFRNAPSARAAVEALQDALGLRSTDAPDGCEAPLPPAQHAALVDDAIAFIEGEADEVMLAVARRRDEAAARNRPDVSEREDRRLDRLRRLRGLHGDLEAAIALNVLVMAPSTDAASEACFLFCGGRLAARTSLPRRLTQRERAHAELAALLETNHRPKDVSRSFVRQDEIDQLFILAAWNRERREGLSYVPLPDRAPEPGEAAKWAAAVLDGEMAPA